MRTLCVQLAMSKSSVIKKVEKIIGERFPGGLDAIIVSAGYDTKTALLNLNSEDIESIEKYTSEYRTNLTGTTYEKEFGFLNEKTDSIFKLKPGHRSFLLNLPKRLKEFNESEQKGKREKKEQSTNLNDDKLKLELFNKIVKYFADNNITLVSDISILITSFEHENGKISCFLSCPFCAHLSPCEYKSYWRSSNFQKHCRKHFTATPIEQAENSAENTNSSLNKVVNYSEEHSDQLNTILGSVNSSLAA